MSDRIWLSLDLLYVAIENLIINADDGDGHSAELDVLLTLATDMKESIAGYWQAVDRDVDDGIELGG